MSVCCNVKHIMLKHIYVMFQVELSKFVADHDFCLEIKYEEPYEPHVIIEKADALKGAFL